MQRNHRFPTSGTARRAVVGSFLAVLALGACGSDGDTVRARPISTSHAASTPAPTLPDLDDPAVRLRFACSFAPGYFTEPAPLATAGAGIATGAAPVCDR